MVAPADLEQGTNAHLSGTQERLVRVSTKEPRCPCTSIQQSLEQAYLCHRLCVLLIVKDIGGGLLLHIIQRAVPRRGVFAQRKGLLGSKDFLYPVPSKRYVVSSIKDCSVCGSFCPCVVLV